MAARKVLPVLAIVSVTPAAVAVADQQILRSDVYLAGQAAGYWLIQGAAQNPPGYVGPGKWVYCVDISPAVGWAGDTNNPPYYVVEVGEGGWGWDDGSGRNPCLQVRRTVALTPPAASMPPDATATAPSAAGTSVPTRTGPGSASPDSTDGSGDLYQDLRRSGR